MAYSGINNGHMKQRRRQAEMAKADFEGSLEKARQISEKVFQEQIRKAAILTGWKIYHTWNSFRSAEGFPDNVLVHRQKKRMIVAELKSQTGRLSEKQVEWLEDFRAIPGVEVYVWRPSQFDEAWEILKR